MERTERRGKITKVCVTRSAFFASTNQRTCILGILKERKKETPVCVSASVLTQVNSVFCVTKRRIVNGSYSTLPSCFP